LRRHRGNADVLRQELAAEKGIIVSLRTGAGRRPTGRLVN
jgi:hypothetical protein